MTHRERHIGTRESRRKYYWLVAVDTTDNKPYLVFGGNTEDEARQKGLEMLPGINFEIKDFPTRNLAMASSMLRGKRLDGKIPLHEASRRQGHEKSLKELIRKRREHERGNV